MAGTAPETAAMMPGPLAALKAVVEALATNATDKKQVKKKEAKGERVKRVKK